MPGKEQRGYYRKEEVPAISQEEFKKSTENWSLVQDYADEHNTTRQTVFNKFQKNRLVLRRFMGGPIIVADPKESKIGLFDRNTPEESAEEFMNKTVERIKEETGLTEETVKINLKRLLEGEDSGQNEENLKDRD